MFSRSGNSIVSIISDPHCLMYLGPRLKTCAPFAMRTWVRLIFPKTHPDIAQHTAGEGCVLGRPQGGWEHVERTAKTSLKELPFDAMPTFSTKTDTTFFLDTALGLALLLSDVIVGLFETGEVGAA